MYLIEKMHQTNCVIFAYPVISEQLFLRNEAHNGQRGSTSRGIGRRWAKKKCPYPKNEFLLSRIIVPGTSMMGEFLWEDKGSSSLVFMFTDRFSQKGCLMVDSVWQLAQIVPLAYLKYRSRPPAVFLKLKCKLGISLWSIFLL